MKSMTFSYLLDKLLYLSKQKKTSLAKALGYDISYISKWTSGKNLPVPKYINDICSCTAKFVVDSLNQDTMMSIKDYFQIDEEINDKEKLSIYLEELLKDSYDNTTQKNLSVSSKNSYYDDEEYNGVVHVNPRLRKIYLSRDIEKYMNKSNKIDLIISANLNRIGESDKISISDIKSDLFKKKDRVESRVRILLSLDDEFDDVVFDTIMIINMIAMYPNMNFQVYNCEVESNSIISIVKDCMLHTANFMKDKSCLLSTMSRDKRIVEDMYYSLDNIINNHGIPIVEKKTLPKMIKEKIHTQYFMTQDMRWIIGSINELFMPDDLFMEVAHSLYKDKEILEEINKINIVLQNITYKSKVKVLIYASELKRYMSSGKINFFNTPVELNFEQRKRHINYLKYLIVNCENIQLKLIESDFIEYFKDYKSPSLYLSKNIKMIQTDHEEEISDYAVIKDKKFKCICDEFYNNIWDKKEDIIVSDKEEILDILEKELTYASIMNDSYINDKNI